MKYIIKRENFLNPLIQVSNVVERKQTLPILSNVFMILEKDQLKLTGTDLEVEVTTWTNVLETKREGQCTVNARKLLDICKALPEDSDIEINVEDDQFHISSGKSKFNLKTLDAKDYPRIETQNWIERFRITNKDIRSLINKTSISMAHQDVRYFLNGILFDINKSQIVSVATDGHRLSKTEVSIDGEISSEENIHAIIPRKAVIELSKIFNDTEEFITVEMNKHHIRFTLDEYIFTSKLIDGKFPDYKAVMGVSLPIEVRLNRLHFLEILQRASILTNEKFRGVRLAFSDDVLSVTSNNPDQEKASDEMSIDYQNDEIEIGFNVNYIVDVLKTLNDEDVSLFIRDSNSSCVLSAPNDTKSKYLIMPMRI